MGPSGHKERHALIHRPVDLVEHQKTSTKGDPADLSDEEILRRLVALNAERVEEVRRGIIRWRRPEFQNPSGTSNAQRPLALPQVDQLANAKPTKKTLSRSTAATARRARNRDRTGHVVACEPDGKVATVVLPLQPPLLFPMTSC